MEPITLGVCALDRKARSKPMQNILNRILANKDLDIHIVNFGDKVSALAGFQRASPKHTLTTPPCSPRSSLTSQPTRGQW